MSELDVVIPVYNEGENILRALEAFRQNVKTPYRILICYDQDSDNTLPAARAWPHFDERQIVFIKNPRRGPHGAICAGLSASQAPAVLVHMADDDFNPPIVDKMVDLFRQGNDVVVASRFVPGGCMVG